MITEDGGHGECRTLHLLQKCCVIHALFPAVRRAIPWDKCSLQDSTAKQCQPLCTTDACPAAALGFSPTLGNTLFHRCWAEGCSHIQVTLHEASGGVDGLIHPRLVQHLLCLTWAGLGRATGALLSPGTAATRREIQWDSEVTCRQPVQQDLMIIAVWGWQELNWHNAPPDLVNPAGLKQLSLLWFTVRATGNEVDLWDCHPQVI